MNQERARRLLVDLLQLAYSGERAAAYAYQGHAASVKDPEERDRIKAIEQDEWQHRDLVGGILRDLGERPDRWREAKAVAIGRAISFICHARAG